MAIAIAAKVGKFLVMAVIRDDDAFLDRDFLLDDLPLNVNPLVPGTRKPDAEHERCYPQNFPYPARYARK